jgi:hypothetical protein
MSGFPLPEPLRIRFITDNRVMAEGATLAELARSYDVSKSTISRLTGDHMTANWIAELVSCLDGAFQDQLEIDRAYLIKHQHIPRYLYKYRQGKSHHIKQLETDTIWLCSPNRYNDPYDCAHTISFRHLTAESLRRVVDRLPYWAKLREFLSDDEITAIRTSPNPMRTIVTEFMGR